MKTPQDRAGFSRGARPEARAHGVSMIATQQRRPVAVVGAGPGGLAAAMLLAASDVPVRVYESQPAVGGRTARVAISPDGAYAADLGPTFFLMPYVLEEVFAACGRRLSDDVELRRLDPMYRLVVGGAGPGGADAAIETTQDLAEMRRRLALLSPRDADAFERYILENRRKLALMTPVLRAAVKSPLDLLGVAPVRMGTYLGPHLSVSRYLERRFEHPVSRLALSFQSKYLGMSPLECPSLFSFLPFIEYEYGVWHPVGGCNAVMAAMARACREMGVEVRCGAPVEGIEFRGRRAAAVIAAGERHEHDHIVINADATWALKRLIPPEVRRRAGGAYATDEQIDAKRYSCSTFMLYLGLRGGVDLPHHTVYISRRYRENLEDICRGGRLSEDPSVYVCNPCVTDPTLAPPGDSALYVLMPAPNLRCGGGIPWDAGAAEQARRLCLEQLGRRLGVRGVEGRIVCERTVTPRDWERMNINFGAAFNLAHTLGQMLHRRVHNRMPGVDGVWFVGGATHPGSGLPVIWLSAQTTTRLLCGELGVTYAGDRRVGPWSSPSDAAPRARSAPAHV